MDIHELLSTVREALEFSALLRQNREIPREEKLRYVDTIVKLLQLEDLKHTLIGRPGAGLSVEQRKRLTIGVELVAKPSILIFLDEPTSGLDGQAANNTVRFLRKLAEVGQAVLVTIHQPSADLFVQFDTLLLLAKGGKTVYFGDIGHHTRTVKKYFADHGLQPIFIDRRNVYETREKKSKTYHWVPFVTGLIVSKLPYLVVCSSTFFVAMFYEMLYTGIGQSIAAIYYLDPFNYLFGAFLTFTTFSVDITCERGELAVFNPAANEICGDYLSIYQQGMGRGTNLLNLGATENCEVCRYTTGQDYLKTLNLNEEYYGWRNAGLVVLWARVFYALVFLMMKLRTKATKRASA
ncbi:hypothetical protein N7449_006602 [Penicillium cf. viridicatum]|uniref:ABC transporter domain-containing protein n=1 Tax=Penicillium cf. viridicatum TaxID=2972119 RepID=A0A9W9JFQ8_9EURO|nr:hypothetical protein N7449_006602 [Penicillium cf. viridicatum]